MSQAELENRFTYHEPPNQITIDLYVDIRNRGKEFAQFVTDNTTASREASLAITKIEEAVMWANAAIARHGAGS
jgi:hypothetical protein